MFADLALTPTIATLAEAPAFLLSPWKPVVMLLPFLPWLWLISKIFDKHAARFFLPRENWNVAHAAAGIIALLTMVLMPIPGEGAFWAGVGAVIVILAIDVAVFMFVTNRDERVPEAFRLKLDLSKLRASEASKGEKKQGKVSLVLKRPDKTLVEAPDQTSPEFEVRVAAETLYLKAIESRASQIDIQPAQGQGGAATYAATFLIDGVRSAPQTMPPANAQKIMDFWKGAAKLDLNERRKKQIGDVTIERETEKKKVRVNSIGAQAGMRLTLLIEPEAQVRRKLKDLGLLENQTAELDAMVKEGKGTVVLVGMPDGGRTTTLYSVVRLHDAYTTNVQTIELEVQDSLEGVRQNTWDATAEGPDFSTLVRSILRRDPDVVAVAEMVDANTAKEMARADPERTRTYLGVRAEAALPGLVQWFKAIGDNDAAGKVLHGVVAERLVRKLCNNCKVAYAPSADMVKKLGLPPDKVKQLFKKGGQVLIKNKPEVCPVCQGTGYVGQEACFEIYRFTDEDRTLLRAGDLNGLKVELRKRGLPNIQQSALRKALDGITSVEEITRLTAEPQPAAAAKPAPAPAAAAAPAPKK